MNQVANRSANAVAALQGLKKGIANVKSTLVKKGGDPYLRLLKDGSWVYGQEDVEVEAGSAWAINPLSIMHGWVAWKRGEDVDNSGGPLDERMVPASQPKPAEHELPELSDKSGRWDQQYSFSMVCLTGADKGEQVLFKTNSVGGVALVDSILNAISAQLDDDPDNPVPVVVLDSESYKHKRYGQVATPIMDIKTWRALSDDLPDVQAELDEQAEAAPEPEPEPAKPAARRRNAGKAQASAADDDPELAALEAAIAAKKAGKTKPATKPVETEAQKRKRELQEQLAALEADDGDGDDGDGGDGDGDGDDGAVETTANATVAANQPIRRRRNATA